MPTPTVSTEAANFALGATWAALLANVPPELVLGSFGGATIYLMGMNEKPRMTWMAFFSVSFMAGLLGGKMASDIAAGAIGFFGLDVKVPIGMGAMAAASVTIKVLGWLRDNPTFFFKKKGEQQ